MISAQEMEKLYVKKLDERQKSQSESEAKRREYLEAESNRALARIMTCLTTRLEFPTLIDSNYFQQQLVLDVTLKKLRHLGYMVPDHVQLGDNLIIDLSLNLGHALVLLNE